MKLKEDSEKVGLKLNIQKTKIIASGPNASWHIDGKSMETTKDFILGSSKSLQIVTVAMKLKDTWLLGRRAMINPDSILKSRDITLSTITD